MLIGGVDLYFGGGGGGGDEERLPGTMTIDGFLLFLFFFYLQLCFY